MEMHKRKPNRLKEYDYNTPAKYFVTLCTQNRQCLFEMENVVGNDLCVVPCLQNQIIHKWVDEIENKFEEVTVEKYIIMPDHVHFIIFISSIEDKTNNANYAERHAGRSLPEIMRFFKTMTTNEYIKGVKNGKLTPFDKKLWQKSYYDHIIRNQEDYIKVWEYIESNPAIWEEKHSM